jgi:hypothetical protein
MNNDLKNSAAVVVLLFSVLIIGGLIALNASDHHRDGVMFALGSAMVAWLAGHAMLFFSRRIYLAMFGISVLMAIGATARYWP